MNLSEIIQKKIDELRPRFLADIDERLDRFEQIRDLLETDIDTGDLLDELSFGAHRITGLAATMGYADLGRLAHSVEISILCARESCRNPRTTADLLAEIDSLLGEMSLT